MQPIGAIAGDKLRMPADAVEPSGKYKAKIALDYIGSLPARPNAKLILVTAITPTPAGEGKTTTTVGLGDALNLIGKKAMLCLREASMGPCFARTRHYPRHSRLPGRITGADGTCAANGSLC